MSRPKSRRIIIRLSHRKGPARRNPPVVPARAGDTPHWFVRVLFGVYIIAIIWTSLGYVSESSASGAPILAPGGLSRTNFISANPSDVPAYVRGAARVAGVNPSIAEWIVSHESRHHPDALGDNGQSRGMWQINRVYHPEVSDKCAYNVRCSTDWSLRRIHDGYVNEWSTWKYCRAWFDDCPF